MNALELVELAAIVSQHGPTIVSHNGRIADSYAERYWSVCKQRHDAWTVAIKAYGAHQKCCNRADDALQDDDACQAGVSPGQQQREQSLANCIQELLLSEPLVRTWAALACVLDRHHPVDMYPVHKIEPITRGVYLGHTVVHHHAMALLLEKRQVSHATGVHLNRLRKRVEMWSNLLIGYLASHFEDCEREIAAYAVDSKKTEAIAAEVRRGRRLHGKSNSGAVFQTTIRASLLQYSHLQPANPELNRQVASLILSSFNPSLFSAEGVMQSVWMSRLLAVAQDAQIMIDEMLDHKLPPTDTSSESHSLFSKKKTHRFDGKHFF